MNPLTESKNATILPVLIALNARLLWAFAHPESFDLEGHR